MDRLLRDAGGSLALLSYDSAGVLADVDGSNAPTVAVTDSAGVTVAGFTGSRTSAGTYAATLPANLEVLDTYAAAWTWPNGQSRASAFELVGGFIFTVADLRASYAPFANTTNYPSATLKTIRDAVEDVFESDTVTRRAFRPRGNRQSVLGSGSDTLYTGVNDIYKVVSLVVSSGGVVGTPPTVSTIRPYPDTTLRVESGTWSWGTVTVLYEYGIRSVPAKIKLEALKYAKSLLLEGPLDEGRATAVFSDIGGYRLTIAGRDGPTGIPSVDAALAQFSRVQVPLG